MESEYMREESHKHDNALRCGRAAASAALPAAGGLMLLFGVVFALGAMTGAARLANDAAATAVTAAGAAVQAVPAAGMAPAWPLTLTVLPLIVFAVFATTLLIGAIFLARDFQNPMRRHSLAARLRSVAIGVDAAANEIERERADEKLS
jgi:hypothetical protein